MNIQTLGKQQKLADALARYRDWYVVGGLNDYELAGKVLAALQQIELSDPDAHDCKLDEWLSGYCDHPSHDYALVEQKAETESQAWRGAR